MPKEKEFFEKGDGSKISSKSEDTMGNNGLLSGK